MTNKLSLLIALTIIFPFRLSADFRCPTTGKIVKDGMNQYEVESNCGQPAFKSVVESTGAVVVDNAGDKTQKAQVVAVPQVEEWTYDFGASQLIRKLRFTAGKLTQVETGGYGTRKE